MFFLKDKNKTTTTIEIIVRYKGQRFKFPTGEKVIANHWLKDKERCKEGRVYLDGADINLRLEIWEKHVKNVLNSFSLQFKIPTSEEFSASLKSAAFGSAIKSDPITSFVAFAKSHKENSDRSKGTKNAYQTTINWLEKYEKWTGKVLTFTDINSKFYISFRDFLYQSGRVNSPNFFGTMIKNIKVFMVSSREIHGLSGHKEADFKKVEVEADNIYLSVEELMGLHNTVVTLDMIKKEFKEVTTDVLAQLKLTAMTTAKNKFLIGAFTGLRVSDFSRIEELNFLNNKIRIRTSKGDKGVVIPIHWVVKEILSSGFDLSIKISDQKINNHIKEACKFAGIKDPVTLSKFVKGKRAMATKPKCDWVTTHTARRSGATNMYLAGVPTISIMKITGHRTEKSFMKYIKISQEENAELLSDHAFFKNDVKKEAEAS